MSRASATRRRRASPPALAQAPARLFVEDACAFEPPPVGCPELAGIDPSTATTLGEVIVGSSPGRVTRDEITVYKAMGVAIEDLVAAELHTARHSHAASVRPSRSEPARA